MMEDEDIICIALLKVKLLDALSPNDIKSIASIFNIPIKIHFEQTLNELKKVIASIILIERFDIEDYLCLPKFKRIHQSLYQHLAAYVKTVWELFLNEKNAIQQSNLKSLQQTKTCKDRISNFFNTMICPDPPSESRNNTPNFPRYNYFNQFPENSSQPGMSFSVGPPSYLFPLTNYVANPFSPDYNRQEISPTLVVENGQNMKSERKAPQKIQVPPNNFLQNFKEEYNSQKQISVQINQPPAPIICFCKQDIDSNLVKCKQCQKEFHQKCFQQASNDDNICPFCKLTYKHCYTKIEGEPILTRSQRVQQKLSSKIKIKFNNAEHTRLSNAINQISNNPQKNQWLELRIIKTQNKQATEIQSGVKSCFFMILSEAKKVLNLNQIELNLQRISENGFIFIILGLVSPRQQKQIIRQIQSKADNSKAAVIARQIITTKNKESQKISLIHPILQQPITVPVRGPRCQHMACQDFSYIYKHGISHEQKIICNHCHLQYSTFQQFQIDANIYQVIKDKSNTKDSITLNLRSYIEGGSILHQQISNSERNMSEQMVDEGEEIGSHSQSHSEHPQPSKQQQINQK